MRQNEPSKSSHLDGRKIRDRSTIFYRDTRSLHAAILRGGVKDTEVIADASMGLHQDTRSRSRLHKAIKMELFPIVELFVDMEKQALRASQHIEIKDKNKQSADVRRRLIGI